MKLQANSGRGRIPDAVHFSAGAAIFRIAPKRSRISSALPMGVVVHDAQLDLHGADGSKIGASAALGVGLSGVAVGGELGLHVGGPLFGGDAAFVRSAGAFLGKRGAGPRLVALVEEEVGEVVVDDDGGQFLVGGRVFDGAGIGEAEADAGDFAVEGDPLLHPAFVQRFAAGPVDRHALHVEAVFDLAGLQDAGRLALVIAAM